MKRLKKYFLLFFVVSGLALIISDSGRAFQAGGSKPAAKPAAPAEGGSTPTGTAGGKYTDKFDHFAKAAEGKVREAHLNLTTAQNCEVCHERADNKPDVITPYHDSCVRCHAVQFSDTKLEICADCHDKPYSDKPKVVDFPKLNQFGMEFSHASHKARANFNCETCHVTPADGKTARSGFPAHKECYECHQFTNQPAKGNCNECHNDKAQAQKFRTRGQIDIAYKYFKFNHGVHMVQPLVQTQGCEACHDVAQSDATTNTDVSRIKVTLSPDPTRIHKSVCFKCHDPNPSGTGQQCYKCHQEAEKPIGSLALQLPKDYVKP